MKRAVDRVLREYGKLSARAIARQLGCDRTEVNAFLYSNQQDYKRDDKYLWSVAGARELTLQLSAGWTTAVSFEGALFEGCSSQSPRSMHISFEKDCNLMFDAIARVLAVANNAVRNDCEVVLDFSESGHLKNFLNRAGFFDHLNSEVQVLPKRPRGSAARAHRGQSAALVELCPIALDRDNSGLIEDLCRKFVVHSSQDHMNAATTMFSELVNNVREHSDAQQGFAGFQVYGGRRPHIQTVVSDDGEGIATTLRTTLGQHHPELFRRYGARSTTSDMNLVEHAVCKGEVSRFGKGRGLGLKSSHERTKRFNAEFSVRQEEFTIMFKYRDGILVPTGKRQGLVPLRGTHICFDFFLLA